MCLVVELTTKPGSYFLLVTKRSLKVSTHKGQIGFAGGHRDTEDANPTATALRETYEELGILPEFIQVFGALPFELSIHSKIVVPIYGFCQLNPEELQISTDEVAKVIFFPMDKIWRGRETSSRFRIFGLSKHTFIYKHGGHHIWGLTAKIIFNADFNPIPECTCIPENT